MKKKVLEFFTLRRVLGFIFISAVFVVGTIFRQNIEELAKQEGWDTVLVKFWREPSKEETPLNETSPSLLPLLFISFLIGGVVFFGIIEAIRPVVSVTRRAWGTSLGFLIFFIAGCFERRRLFLSAFKIKEICSPLEIIFDSSNPSKRFWSMESARGKNKSVFWEYRVEIKNKSSKTIRNVSVTVEHTGLMPVRPVDQFFDKSGIATCDLRPGSSELVPVLQWPIPIVQAGMLAGSTALEYGPIKVIAVADDVSLVTRNFQFDYQAEPMLFE